MQIQAPKNFELDGDQSISLNITFDDIVHGAENGCTFYATLKGSMERYSEPFDHSEPIEVSLCYGPGDTLDVWFKRICSSKGTCDSPARLLKLVQDESTMCLVPNHQHYRYAAPSYCWGGDRECKLTQARLAAYQASITVVNLPKSVQAATQVAQSLDGISYIWIDSLCIIQDDDDAKGSQLVKMGDIYRGATVIISAASARSCYEGFLKSRECPEKAKPISKAAFISETATRAEVYLVPRAGREGNLDPINHRAWTLQEHVLSPRILYHTSLQPCSLCRSERKSDGGMRFPQALESRRYGDEMDLWAIDLGWMAEQPQPCPSRREGPSWSWTSISGAANKVEREMDTKDTIEVVSFDVKWKIPGVSSGEIQSATLRPRAWMKLQKLRFGPARRRVQFAD
ncbi:HET domain-containing protein [Fusarium falciforme]|uniref:HET domain-containing protein n=1 Tax=Fusarium falciforme TaxID=195108 RepID=UPI0022FFD3A7|nr:HET domain-containing protein [Fusarium falciforme]WAO96757.1 HET domain-containing protein [Fusarium falciforme]